MKHMPDAMCSDVLLAVSYAAVSAAPPLRPDQIAIATMARHALTKALIADGLLAPGCESVVDGLKALSAREGWMKTCPERIKHVAKLVLTALKDSSPEWDQRDGR
jgi:hypothetical protein